MYIAHEYYTQSSFLIFPKSTRTILQFKFDVSVHHTPTVGLTTSIYKCVGNLQVVYNFDLVWIYQGGAVTVEVLAASDRHGTASVSR